MSCQITKNQINFEVIKNNSIMDILDIIGHFYLNHLSPLWGYFWYMNSLYFMVLHKVNKWHSKLKEECKYYTWIQCVEYWIHLNETNSDVHMYTLIIYFIHWRNCSTWKYMLYKWMLILEWDEWMEFTLVYIHMSEETRERMRSLLKSIDTQEIHRITIAWETVTGEN